MQAADKVSVYIGIALDKPNEKVILASFRENESEAVASVQEQCPGMPYHVCRMFDDVKKVREDLYAFLGANGVPENEHHQILKMLADGIRGMMDEEDDDEHNGGNQDTDHPGDEVGG